MRLAGGLLIVARSVTALAVLMLLALPAVPAQPEGCDLVDVPLVGLACERPDGTFDVFDAQGQFIGTVHGPDPAPRTATQGWRAPPPVAPTCVAPGSSYSASVLYARMPGVADRSSTMVPQIREMVHVANAYVANAAAKSGIGVSMKVQCSGDAVSVTSVQLSTSTRTWQAVTDDLRAKGYTDPTVKYWVWHDDGTSTCAGGVGSFYDDDRPGAENWNNGNGVALFAITWSCMRLDGAQVMSHENGHNMGAVQDSAPRSTGGAHCIDGLDIMCYADDGPRGLEYDDGSCPQETVYDCGRDDYFHPAPASGSYLATHWNVGSTNNRFLARTACALDARGTLVAGVPTGTSGGGVFGVNIVRQPIPSSCWGRPFGLVGVGGVPQDFDVCMERADGSRLQCFATEGDEQGVVPSGTAHAGIFYVLGAQGEWRLSAV